MQKNLTELRQVKVVGNKKNPRCNSEGYADPTAYEALKPIIKEETALENKMSFIVKMFKFIAAESGFEIIHRIELKDQKTGRVFK